MTRTLNPFHSGSNAKPSPASTPTCVPRPGGVGCLRSVKVAFSAAYRKPAATSRRHQVPLTPQAETFFPSTAYLPTMPVSIASCGVGQIDAHWCRIIRTCLSQYGDRKCRAGGGRFYRILPLLFSNPGRQAISESPEPGWGCDLPCDYLSSAWQDLKESLRGSGLYPDYFYARYPKSTRGK
jgi:hypothetical protein